MLLSCYQTYLVCLIEMLSILISRGLTLN